MCVYRCSDEMPLFTDNKTVHNYLQMSNIWYLVLYLLSAVSICTKLNLASALQCCWYAMKLESAVLAMKIYI